jgi:hypothetical protein
MHSMRLGRVTILDSTIKIPNKAKSANDEQNFTDGSGLSLEVGSLT